MGKTSLGGDEGTWPIAKKKYVVSNVTWTFEEREGDPFFFSFVPQQLSHG
jgi:hypothetical protein